jgi:hypothetical protein
MDAEQLLLVIRKTERIDHSGGVVRAGPDSRAGGAGAACPCCAITGCAHAPRTIVGAAHPACTGRIRTSGGLPGASLPRLERLELRLIEDLGELLAAIGLEFARLLPELFHCDVAARPRLSEFLHRFPVAFGNRLDGLLLFVGQL